MRLARRSDLKDLLPFFSVHLANFLTFRTMDTEPFPVFSSFFDLLLGHWPFSQCRKEHLSPKLEPSLVFVLLTFGRVPIVTRWIRASLLAKCSSRLLELSASRTSPSWSSTIRRILSAFSWRVRANGFTLVFAFSTFTFVVTEAQRFSLATLAFCFFWQQSHCFLSPVTDLPLLLLSRVLLSRFICFWPRIFNSGSFDPRPSSPCFFFLNF